MTKHSEHLLTIEITVALLSKYSLFKSLKGLESRSLTESYAYP